MNQKIELKIDELQKIANFLHKNIGICLEEEKLKRFKRKIEDILIKNNIKTFNEFYHLIRFEKDEKLIQELINAITINETYFWRENEQFEILTKEILPQIVNNSKIKMPTIRILVLPTSSGEELYSIMISLLEDNKVINQANIELLGVDIDSSMISKAKMGLYSKRSVEKLPLNLINKYFTKIGNFYQIDKKLIKYANFLQGNLFNETFVSKLREFDVIFSRNMLIYFDKNDKQKAFNIFYNLLKKDGYLFLGHADGNFISKEKFLHVKSGYHIFKKL